MKLPNSANRLRTMRGREMGEKNKVVFVTRVERLFLKYKTFSLRNSRVVCKGYMG